MQNLFLFNSTEDGTLLSQVLHGGIGTRPKASGAHENNSFLRIFQTLHITLQGSSVGARFVSSA